MRLKHAQCRVINSRSALPLPIRSCRSTSNQGLGRCEARANHEGPVGPKEHRRPSSSPDADEAAVALQPLDAEERGEEQFLARFMNACIKVYATHCEPNFSLPWARKRQMTSTSSGFIAVYEGKRYLLTNAHSVDYHTQVTPPHGDACMLAWRPMPTDHTLCHRIHVSPCKR